MLSHHMCLPCSSSNFAVLVVPFATSGLDSMSQGAQNAKMPPGLHRIEGPMGSSEEAIRCRLACTGQLQTDMSAFRSQRVLVRVQYVLWGPKYLLSSYHMGVSENRGP